MFDTCLPNDVSILTSNNCLNNYYINKYLIRIRQVLGTDTLTKLKCPSFLGVGEGKKQGKETQGVY